MDQFGGARGADDHRLGLEAGKGVAGGVLEQVGGIAAQIAGLKGGVGDGRAVVAPFDHGEEKVGIGIALRGVQHVMQPLHARGHPHGPDMGRSFIGPEGQFHSAAP